MSIEKKFVIIDEIMEQLEAAKSGVVPGSVSQSVVSGIQNVPTSIVQQNVGGGGAGAYTTFPLSPIIKNCCIDKSYLNFEFDNNYRFEVTLAANAVNDKIYKIPFHYGMRDTSSMFNQIQVLIENTSIWSTVYQREESVVAYNALPETEIRGNNQYASIEKMQNGKYSPMKRIIVEFKGVTGTTAADGNGIIDAGKATGSKDVKMHFKCTVDLNRITPLLSNLHYTTPHMGNLRLKVFLQEFEKCLFFCPDYSYYAFTPAGGVRSGVPCACADNTAANIDIAVNATVAGLTTNAANQPLQNQYWSFYPLSSFWNQDIAKTKIPFYYTTDDASGLNVATNVKFSKAKDDFMTFKDGIAEIVQTNFEIKSEEYERLTNYFASTGSVIIPTQTWSTSVFNTSSIDAPGNLPSSLVGNVGGYNLNFVTLFFHPNKSPCYFNNEFLTQFQLILDGRPINAIPYDYVNDKCIVDMTQAVIDTDHEEINQSLMDSLTFLNETDTKEYISNNPDKPGVTVTPRTLYGTGGLNSSINKSSLRNPATCMYNFSTNLPDAFHSGACILENSNRQAVIRLTAGSAADNANFTQADREEFPYFINHRTTGESTTAGFTCFCDACIVLNFDAARNTCFDGQLSWASPYVD